MAALPLSGCIGAWYGPRPAIDLNEEIYQARVDYYRPKLTDRSFWMTYGGAKTEAEKEAFRDQTIDDLVYIVDHDYYGFRANFVAGTAATSFLASAVETGVNAAATAVDAKDAKTILSAIATGISGAETDASQDILYSKQVSTIVNQMDSDRHEKLLTIYDRMYPGLNLVNGNGGSTTEGSNPTPAPAAPGTQNSPTALSTPQLSASSNAVQLFESNNAVALYGTVAGLKATTQPDSGATSAQKTNANGQLQAIKSSAQVVSQPSTTQAYPIEWALKDVQEYYQKGTIVSAVDALVSTTGQNSQTSANAVTDKQTTVQTAKTIGSN